MSPQLAGALTVGFLTLLLSVTRHALAVANHLQLVRGASIQEMALFARLSGFGSFVLLFVLPFVVGYAVGGRIDFEREYGSLVVAISLGGGLGYFLGTAIIVPATSVTPGLTLTLALLLGGAIAVAIEVAIVCFAGGALAHLRRVAGPVTGHT